MTQNEKKSRRQSARSSSKGGAPPLVSSKAAHSHGPKPSRTAGGNKPSSTTPEPYLAPKQTKDKDAVSGFDIAPDGTSGGREPRQFTVAKVGNHGRIYLRPSTRNLQQKLPQPDFAFPTHPPDDSGGINSASQQVNASLSQLGNFRSSLWTPESVASPLVGSSSSPTDFFSVIQQSGHRRAMSDSTLPDPGLVESAQDAGTFRVVIAKPVREEARPRTTEDLADDPSHLLNVAIPSWRMGRPRFSLMGTPVWRGSSYAATEDMRASHASSILHRASLAPGYNNNSSSKHSQGMRQPNRALDSIQDLPKGGPPRLGMVFSPPMFDQLTFKPACDSPSVVQYHFFTLAVKAATIPRLVAEITSPSFLDYDLLSDFFLTYRCFVQSADLLAMLVARLRWALARSDEVGLVVRVRTFVAIRHWILNYFLDDFVLDHGLRVSFCELVNGIVDDLSDNQVSRKIQQKIIVELKKCWRRVCGLYWDGVDFDEESDVNVPIAPGGIAGHRDHDLGPSFWEHDDSDPPQLDVTLTARGSDSGLASLYMDVSQAGHVRDVTSAADHYEKMPSQARPDREQTYSPLRPASLTSLDVASCYLPLKALRTAEPVNNPSLAAHPVLTAVAPSRAGLVAKSPRALVGKRVRPKASTETGHGQRNAADSTNGTRKVSHKNHDVLVGLPHSGSLVRGNVLAPSHGFVDVDFLKQATSGDRQTTVFAHHELAPRASRGGVMSAYGMKKLMTTIRRALGTKVPGQAPAPPTASTLHLANFRYVAPNQVPGAAEVPVTPLSRNGFHPPVRIDLLAAETAEDFKKAVREDAANEAGQRAPALPEATEGNSSLPLTAYSVAHLEPSTLSVTGPARDNRPVSDMAMTTGSKSIVIVDDTMPLGLRPLSVKQTSESWTRAGTRLTPPNTPPNRVIDGAAIRRSSVSSFNHSRHSSSFPQQLPFLPEAGLKAPEPALSSMYEHGHWWTSSGTPKSIRSPAVETIRSQRSQLAKTPRSFASFSVRRVASFNSVGQQSQVRSFDATTVSGNWEQELLSSPAPRPLRILRRRPGGDLRAVEHVGDLRSNLLRRSRSFGSLTGYSESLRSTFTRTRLPDSLPQLDMDRSTSRTAGTAHFFSLGLLTDNNAVQPGRSSSMAASTPAMRPSFEVEAQKLAQIPDEDDGGVESALLKLEGKFDKTSSVSSGSCFVPERLVQSDYLTAVDPDMIGVAKGSPSEEKRDKTEHRHHHLHEEVVFLPSGEAEAAGTGTTDLRLSSSKGTTRTAGDIKSFLSEASAETESSIPLLDSGLTDEARSSKRDTKGWTDQSILEELDTESESGDHTPVRIRSMHTIDTVEDAARFSFHFIQKPDSLYEVDVKPESRQRAEGESFLNDESDDEAELSSEISQQGSGQDFKHQQTDQSPGCARCGSRMQDHQCASKTGLPSPPVTDDSPASHVAHGRDKPRWPRSSASSPMIVNFPERASSEPTDARKCTAGAHDDIEEEEDSDSRAKYTAHLPFILAFGSDILAEQFTLIEMDALNEIEWKDLIAMRWRDSHASFLSWVTFLRNSDIRGVDVVVARFNLVVKWAISEIVLTQDVEERARCIIKMIHVASHCRTLGNFATVSQLSVALGASEVTRLSKTWALVPESDQSTLRGLEAIVTPRANFRVLRLAMESGMSTACIPFMGVYYQDLLATAVLPSEVAGTPDGPPLVNFERCRIIANTIKTVLRLMESSTKYEFQPIAGLTERCLWISALNDEQIRHHSRHLE